MKFFFKRVMPGILAFCLIFTMAIPARTAEAASKKVYTDVSGHKYEDALLYAIENGLMSNSQSKIFPDSRLTKGAACLSLNALLGAVVQFEEMDEVSNLKKGDQYYNTVSVGLNCGYLKQKANGDVYSPLVPATYAYVADIFSSVLGIDMSAQIIGTKNPKATLTRGEYAVILQKLAPNIVTKNTSKVVSGDVYITNPNVVLSNTTVNGNLIITDAVGDKNVTLRNVEISGNLIVRGGGENSINIIGTSNVGDVIVKQVNHPVSVKVLGSAKVENLQVGHGSIDVRVQGKVSKLTVIANLVKVALEGATISKVEVSGKGTALAVSEKTKVQNITINEVAEGTKLEVSGSIEDVVVAAKDSAVDVKGKGSIKEVKAEKTANNFSVAVDKEAVISNINSEADNTVVDGEGTVENAVMTGDGSSVSTENTVTANATPAPTSTPSTSTPSTTTPSPAPSRIAINKVTVLDDAQTIEVTLSANISTTTISVSGVEVDGTPTYNSTNNTYTVKLKTPLTGNDHTVTVSRTGYISATATISGSVAPQYKAFDDALVAAATTVNGKMTVAELITSDITNGNVTLKIEDENAKISEIYGTVLVNITSFITSNKVTGIRVGTDNVSTTNVFESIKNIVGSNKTLNDLVGNVEVKLTFQADGIECTKTYKVSITK